MTADIDDLLTALLKELPDEYGEIAARLRGNADYKAMLKIWFLGRERIIRKAKSTGNIAWMQALIGYDDCMGLVERIGGGRKSNAQKEKEVLAIKQMEGLI